MSAQVYAPALQPRHRQPIAAEVLYACSGGALNPIRRDIPYQRLPKERLWPWNADPFKDE